MNDKCWVQHKMTGDLGWLVSIEDPDKPIPAPDPGKTMVRLDRPGRQTRPYADGKWRLRDQKMKLPKGTKAGIAYEALRKFAEATGDYASARKELSAMDDDKRISFIHEGPSALEGRVYLDARAQKLWDAIFEALEE